MLKRLFALCLFADILLLAVAAFGQTNPAQSPIVCEVKNNVEDADCQNKLKGLFTRKGDMLTLKLEGGKSKTYVGNRAACDGEHVDVEKCLVFVVLSYFPRTQSYLIERGYYECGAYVAQKRTSTRHYASSFLMCDRSFARNLFCCKSIACAAFVDVESTFLELSEGQLLAHTDEC